MMSWLSLILSWQVLRVEICVMLFLVKHVLYWCLILKIRKGWKIILRNMKHRSMRNTLRLKAVSLWLLNLLIFLQLLFLRKFKTIWLMYWWLVRMAWCVWFLLCLIQWKLLLIWLLLLLVVAKQKFASWHVVLAIQWKSFWLTAWLLVLLWLVWRWN